MRIFVAIPLPENVRERLGGLCSGLPHARWISPENMHVTLRFIGEVDNGAAEDIDAALGAIQMPSFDISVSHVGFFERGRKVHTIWAGIEGSDAIVRLRDKVESAAVRTGCEPEKRKFKPHVTLARLRGVPARRVSEYLHVQDGFFAGPFAVERFMLFRSHLGHGGAHYQTLADYPLEFG